MNQRSLSILPITDIHTSATSPTKTPSRLPVLNTFSNKTWVLKGIKNEKVKRDKRSKRSHQGDAIKSEVKEEGKEAHRGTVT